MPESKIKVVAALYADQDTKPYRIFKATIDTNSAESIEKLRIRINNKVNQYFADDIRVLKENGHDYWINYPL